MNEKFLARFGWFWYNDTEILHDTQEDIDRKVHYHYEQGITHLITFSSTHFRWSFRPYWSQINQCIAKIVKAGHKYGIKIIEHHSATLAHYPDTKDHWDEFENEMQLRGSSTNNWPGLEAWMLDPDNEMDHWIQYSCETSKPAVPYSAHARCFNNPEYVRAYLDYLASVYAQGVDGIMTDDVAMYRPWSCGCPHCRNLFKATYGYELPSPDHWKEWFGNYENPAFMAWLKFRYDTIRNFHQRVKEHYESLGLNLLRPTYTSVALCPNHTAYVLDDLPAQDWAFQECCYSTIIRYTWPLYWLDQLHRRMMEKQKGTPAMMMFYADTPDKLIFSWGIARLSASLFTNTPEGKTCMDESALRTFEKKYGEWLFDCNTISTVGFVDSLENRRFGAGYEASRMKFWIQSCLFENIPCELVDIQHPEQWTKLPMLCVNEIHVLSQNEIDSLLKYAENGGTLVISGMSGIRDETLKRLNDSEVLKRWHFSNTTVAENGFIEEPWGKGRIVRTGMLFGYPGEKAELKKMFCSEWNDVEEEDKIIDLRKDIYELWQDDHSPNAEPVPNNTFYYDGAKARRDITALLKHLAGSNMTFKTCDLPELVLAVPFIGRESRKISIQLLNASNTMKPHATDTMAHRDPIPFPAHSGVASFCLTIPEDAPMPTKAVWTAPDGEEIPLAIKSEGRSVHVSLQLERLKNCGSILL